MGPKRQFFLLLTLLMSVFATGVSAQSCFMEPGFQFLTSSRGCAPFTVQIETLFLESTPGTVYYVNWGDGTPEEVYVQNNSTGVILTHTYPNSPITCGYDVIIDAENGCNPRGSVVPVTTQVIVWTNDVISIDPGEFRVCQGFAASLNFVDNSDWNCFPRATRENNDPRWIQWIYGTGNPANQIPGMRVNGATPGAFPYYDPAPGRNPIYPVTSPGQVSLSIDVPVTTPADIGKEFEVTLRNWNQCNPYDNVLSDGNPFNPVSGDIANGDNAPQVTTGRVVIVPAPQPDFLTRAGNAAGQVQTVFCIDEDIYFDNETPPISGANFQYRWEFYDNSTGAGSPISTSTQPNPTFAYSTSGQKLVRLRVRDANAAGSCESVVDRVITISPSLTARIRITDLANNVISTDFCQEPAAPLTTFDARFHDDSFGTATPTTRYRWEFFDENNTMVFEAPSGGAFSSTPLGPFDRAFTNKGIYRVRLRIRDDVTTCESVDEVTVRVLEKPVPAFTFNRVCEDDAMSFSESSTLNSLPGSTITSWEWDMNYDGTFNGDPVLTNQKSFDYTFPTAGTHTVALRVTASPGGCSAILAQDVIVDPAPLATFTPSTTAGCSVLSLTLTNTAVASQPVTVDRYIWEVDDGGGFVVDSVQRPTDPTFTDQYVMYLDNHGTTDKVYQVRLRAISDNDCESVSAPVAITVFPGPKSGFISVNYSPFDDNCSPQEVDFTVDAETQSLNPTDYTWTVSDNNGVLDVISTGTTPSFSYEFINNTQSMKDFRLSLRATLPSACYGDSTRLIRIAPLPSSAFEVDTLLFDCEVMNLRFEATQKGLSEYAWEVSVNGTLITASTGASDVFEYNFNRLTSLDQNVEVTLRTRNLANCQSSLTMHQVTVPRQVDVIAFFTASPTTQSWPNNTVNLNPVLGPWEYHWDFGDGTTSSNPSVGHHMYAAEGTYVITLTVSDGACMAQHVQSVTISPVPPIVDFTYNPSEGCAPLTVTFTNLSLYADPMTYVWDFGEDGATSHEVNPTYTYRKEGKKTVTLTASNASGEVVSVTKTDIIEVHPPVSAYFNIRPTVVQVPGGRVETDNQSVGATSYLWDFGDGTTSTEFEPKHVYNDPGDGTFDISLIAYNDFGCTDTLKLEGVIHVVEGGRLLIPNAFSPDPSGPGGGNSGGNINDVFLPIMEGVTEFQMLVFNRWGELLFETRDPNHGWDGYYKGQLCQQDVYVYKILAKFSDGQTVTRIGDINLLR